MDNLIPPTTFDQANVPAGTGRTVNTMAEVSVKAKLDHADDQTVQHAALSGRLNA